MSRKVSDQIKQIQLIRADWYEWHFAAREYVKSLPGDLQTLYMKICSMIEPPRMTVYGGPAHDWPETAAFKLAAAYGLDVNYINPWYLTAHGWDAFQAIWRELPEPVELYTAPCVQLGELYTLSTGQPQKETVEAHFRGRK